MITEGTQKSFQVKSSQVVLQVGEKLFAVEVDLLKNSGSPFLIQIADQVGQSPGGVAVIERDPALFVKILSFLRQGPDSISSAIDLAQERASVHNPSFVEDLLEEALFYQLESLSSLLKSKLKPELTRDVVVHLLDRYTFPRDFIAARILGVDLSQLDFIHYEMKGKESRYHPQVVHKYEFKPNFTSANLKWTKFNQTVLSGSDFTDANLSFCDFSEADLTSCSFKRSLLKKTLFRKAIFDGVQFFESHATFEMTNFSEATFQKANFTNFFGETCIFENAVFVECNFDGSRFPGCSFKGSKFEKCSIKGAKFESANLEGVHFNECDLSGSQFTHALVTKARIINCQANDCSFTHSNLQFSKLYGSDFFASQFVATNLQCCEMLEYALNEDESKIIEKNHARFLNVNFKFAQLQGVDFTGVDCTNSDFKASNLTNAVMTHANLTDSNFEGAITSRLATEIPNAEWTVEKKRKTLDDGIGLASLPEKRNKV